MTERVELSLDDHGQLWIPAPLQKRLRLEPGRVLLVEEGGNGGVRLRQAPEQISVVDKQGILVVRAQPTADLADAVRSQRDHRLAFLMEHVAP